MTTATKTRPRKKDPLAELREVERQLEEARADRARLGEQAEKFAMGIRVVEVEYGDLSRTAPKQFDGNGQPKPKTRAGTLKKQLEQAQSSRWPQILDGADQRVSELQRKLGVIIEQNAVELATREFRHAEQVMDDLVPLAAQLVKGIDRLKAREAKLFVITSACQGLDGRDVFWDQRLDPLRELAESVPDMKPPRSVSLTPFEGEEPRRIRTVSGAWTDSYIRDEDIGEQPEKVEPGR